MFSLCIPALSIDAVGTLQHWLSGEPFQTGNAVCQELRGSRRSLQFALSGVPRSLDNQWRLLFDAASTLTVGKRKFAVDEPSILLCLQDANVPDLRSQVDASSAKLITADDWLRAKSSIVALPRSRTALRVRYRAHSDNSRSLVVEPEIGSQQITVAISTAARGSAQIQLENYRFAEAFDGRSISRALVGDITEAGSRLETQGLSINLSGVGPTGRFVAETAKGRLTRLLCKPSAVASRVPVEGALTSWFPLSQPQTIRFAGLADDSDEHPWDEPVRLAQAQLTRSDVPDFLTPGQGPGITTGHVTCSGCALGGKPQDIRYFSTHAIRPEDLLWLGFEFYNFEFKGDKKGKKYLVPLKVPGPALVIVHFPPQHILEDAFNEDLGCAPTTPKISFPLGAKLSGPSRLVFEFPPDEDRLDLTLDALTNWSRWKIRKVPDSRHPRLIRAPSWDETAVEMPSRIVSQPANQTHWRAKKYEGTSAKRYVLFNNELVPDVSFDATEPSGIRRPRFVPIWTPDFTDTGVQLPEKYDSIFLRLRSRLIGLDPFGSRTPGTAVCAPSQAPDDLKPGQSDPLGEGERRDIVRLSHDSTICAEPPAAKYLMLTARGAFADVEGFWPQTRARSCVNISLEKWKQIITEGQDQKITIEKRFLCFPFGHRIIYIKDTNRKIHFQDNAFYAVEKTTYRIVIRQRTITYKGMRVDDLGQDRGFQLPYRSLTITDRVVPNLDQPNYIPDLKKDPPCLDAFWPTRCNKLLELNFEGVDWAGNVVKFLSRVLLVQDTAIPDHVPLIRAEYIKPSVEPAKTDNPRRHDLTGQLSALAPSYQKGDTEVAALRVDFDGLQQNLTFGKDFCPAPDEVMSEEKKCEVLDYGESELSAPFYPIAYAIEARLPSLGRIATSGGGEMWLEITDPLKDKDPIEIFAVQHPDKAYTSRGYTLAFNLESDRSGGVAAPTPTIDSISRLKGPVGLSEPARNSRSRAAPAGGLGLMALGAAGLPTPDSFFSKLDAKILGVLSPRDLLRELGIDLSMPSLLSYLAIGGDTPSITGFIYDWDTEKLQDWPGGDFGFQFKNHLDDETARLSIRGGVQLKLFEGAQPVGFIAGSLTNFTLRLVFIGNGIEAPFPNVRFHAPLGEKVKFDVEIGNVKFVGPLMEFAAALKKFLKLGDGYDIDVRFDSLTASIGPFALPAIGFGVFSLSNIGFTALCSIYFRGNRPLSFGFGFASRDKPFTLAVAFLAGRGHFLFEVDVSGLQRIEASLEFGAYAELAFGSVAHGYLYVMGGIFYSSAKVPVAKGDAQLYTTEIALEIYIRFGGGLTCLGFISISVDVHLGLTVTKRDTKTFAEGRATITYSIKIGFFKKSFSVSYSKSLAGSDTEEQQGALLVPNAPIFAGRLTDLSAQKVREGSSCSTVSCVKAIGKPGFQTYWYAFESRLGA
jgi:hypothetical protein